MCTTSKQRLMLMIASLLVLPVTTLLQGCGSARTVVTDAPAVKSSFAQASVVEESSTVPVPDDAKTLFVERVNRSLFDDTTFKQGAGGLRLSYRFVSFSAGSQFERWFWGGLGNAGEGSVTVEVRFLDQSGKQLAKIQSDGRIGSGVFGGSMQDAVKNAAEEVAKFAKANFAVIDPKSQASKPSRE